ncbi:MAG: 2-succinyl-6-hydroxy-2,4-cyclohexadiene-1-carboxylate synthase, partial [Anaerolineae bacterium]
ALSLRGMGTGAQPSLWGKIERSDSLSVNLIAGELDTKFVGINRRMQALMPNARLKVVAGAGHSVHLEKPETWAAIVSQTERKSF